jgi:hypothetical protein
LSQAAGGGVALGFGIGAMNVAQVWPESGE